MKHSKNIWSLLIQKKHAVCAALAAVILVMMQAACTVLEVIVLQRFLDGFSAAVFRLGQSLSCIAVLAAIYAFRYFRTPLLNWLNGSITLQLRELLEHLIIKKAARISLVSLEHADHQALLRRVQDVPEKRYTNGLFAILEIMSGMLQTAGVLFLLAGRVPCFLTVILLLLGMMVVVFRIIGKNRVKLYQARQEIGRRGDYLSGILFDRTLAQEKKLFGYTHYIQKIYETEEKNMRLGFFPAVIRRKRLLIMGQGITLRINSYRHAGNWIRRKCSISAC